MAVKSTTQPSAETVPSTRWPPAQGEWTYEDYVQLSEQDIRYEVIKGELYMPPSPSSGHQRVIARLHGYLWEFLRNQSLGDVFFAPIDVILPGLASPVQPDLLFITKDRLSIVKEKFIEGAPDLIVEVLSPGNPMHDRRTKFQLYAQARVKEYWIVDSEARTIDIYVLRGQAYAPLGHFGADEQILSEVLADFKVTVGEICLP